MCSSRVPVSGGRALVCRQGVVVLCGQCDDPAESPMRPATATSIPLPAGNAPRTGAVAAEAASIANALAGAVAQSAAAIAQTAASLAAAAQFKVSTRPLVWGPIILLPLMAFLVAPTAQGDAERLGLIQYTTTTATVAEPLERLGAVRLSAAESPPTHALTYGVIEGEQVKLNWYHPLAGPIRHLPHKGDRQFGARRGNRIPRPECGRGHCGNDLGGIPGTIIHAILPGRVTRIVQDPHRRSGRYVRLEHEAGFASYYMHLDRIHPKLVKGVEVAAGEPLGTLGSTGIQNSPPHLHFAVAKIVGTREIYVDPEPMLHEAILLESQSPFPTEARPREHAAHDERPVRRRKAKKGEPVVEEVEDAMADAAFELPEEPEAAPAKPRTKIIEVTPDAKPSTDDAKRTTDDAKRTTDDAKRTTDDAKRTTDDAKRKVADTPVVVTPRPAPAGPFIQEVAPRPAK